MRSAGALWAVVVALCGLDVALTHLGLALGAAEANPLVAPAWMAPAKAAALTLILGVLRLLWRSGRDRAVVAWMAAACLGMSGVVAWNCWVVFRS